MLASQLLLPLTDIDPAFIVRSQAHIYIVIVRIARPSAILHERLLVTLEASFAGWPPRGWFQQLLEKTQSNLQIFTAKMLA